MFTTTLTRDIFENVTNVKDPENRETIYARNTLGFVTKVTTPLGAETDYLYDANDVVTETRTDVGITGLHAERIITYSRNIMDLVTDVIELSKTTTYAYDKNDRVTLMTLPVSARKIRHAYDLRGLEITRTTADGTSDSFDDIMVYDGNGRLVTMKNGINNATVMAYDGFDRTTKATDPESHSKTTTYDKNGNVVSIKRFASGDSTELTGDASEFDLNNRRTKSRRWAKKADRSTNLGSSEWMDTTLTYDKSGKLVTKADPCGCGGSTNTVYSYDAAGRLTKTKDAATNEVTYALDKSGLVTKATHAEKESGTTLTYVVEYSYNSDRYLISVSEKGGGSATAHTTSYQVDKLGRATKVLDANGTEVLYDFDDLARMTRTRRGASSDYITTTTTYDLNDNVLTETSVRPGATDTATRHVYDNADRMVTMKDESDVAVKILVYDDASNVVTRKDGNGSEARPTYDKRNLVTQVSYTLATNVVGPTKVKFSYDGLGRVTAAVNQRADAVESRTYDARVERAWNTLSGLEKEKTWINPSAEDGSGSTPRDVEYVHDGSGRVSLIKYPEGATRTTVKRAYDALNRVTSITRQDPGTSGWTSVATWVFQGPARMTTLESGNTAKETMKYDEYGRATEMVHDRLQKTGTRRNMFKFKRFYDAGDRVVKDKREYFFESDTALTGDRDFGDIYVYDPQNRLATVVRGVGAATNSHSVIDSATDTTTDFSTKTHYTFDPGGNRKTLRYDVPSGGSSSARRREDHGFDLENQLTTRTISDWNGSQLTQTASATYSYDVNGTLTTATLKVDVHNRVYEIGSWRYRYDPFGRRIEKRDTSGTYWRRCYYDGVGCIAEWHTALNTGTPTESSSGPMWVRVFGTYLVDHALWAKVDPCGTCGIYVKGYFHLDFLGSSVVVTNADANASGPNAGGYDILETYRYDEYGHPYFFEPDGDAQAASLAGQDYLYTGREWASEHASAAFYYYRARSYDQATGRFLSRDPLGPDTFSNRYGYVGNDPIANTDPYGLEKVPVEPDHFSAHLVTPQNPSGGPIPPWLAAALVLTVIGDPVGPPTSPPWNPLRWPKNTCGPCPPKDPGNATGDGWCNDGTGHPGAKACYRSYGHATTTCAGQQCCYDDNGNLIENGTDSQGTVDLVGNSARSTSENNDGSCQVNVGDTAGHVIIDWRDSWEMPGTTVVLFGGVGRRQYLLIQGCMRRAGVPSGSSSGGPVSNSDVNNAYETCKSAVTRYVSYYGIGRLEAEGMENLPAPPN